MWLEQRVCHIMTERNAPACTHTSYIFLIQNISSQTRFLKPPTLPHFFTNIFKIFLRPSISLALPFDTISFNSSTIVSVSHLNNIIKYFLALRTELRSTAECRSSAKNRQNFLWFFRLKKCLWYYSGWGIPGKLLDSNHHGTIHPIKTFSEIGCWNFTYQWYYGSVWGGDFKRIWLVYILKFHKIAINRTI